MWFVHFLGLLIPMLTFLNDTLRFQVKFSDGQCVEFDKKPNGGPTGFDYAPRIAGNMYSFLNSRFQLIRVTKFK